MKIRLSLFAILLIISQISYSQTVRDSLPSKVVIGITETPPFVTSTPSGFGGLSISSWKLVNEKLQLQYEYKEYENLAKLLSGIERNEVDFSVNPITVTDQRMQRMDFSQPYFISHTNILKRKESVWKKHLFNLFSWEFFSMVLLLIGVILIFGFLVWLFERKHHKEEFGGNVKGLMQGFWWSAVTMTTVGYGDKAPKTTGGRIIGFIWMFMAVIIISSFTAGIASSLTVRSINEEVSGIQDLQKFDVVTVDQSSSHELLSLYNIPSDKVMDDEEGIQKVLDGDYNFFVYDEPILKYEIQRMGLDNKLEIMEQSLKKDYYSYAFPKNSNWISIIDPILVSTLKTVQWTELNEEYN